MGPKRGRVLEDTAQFRQLVFYVEAHAAQRLAQQLQRGPHAGHPVFDFIQALLGTWHATAVRVGLEDPKGEGIRTLVYLRQGELEPLANAEVEAGSSPIGNAEDLTGWLERGDDP